MSAQSLDIAMQVVADRDVHDVRVSLVDRSVTVGEVLTELATELTGFVGPEAGRYGPVVDRPAVEALSPGTRLGGGRVVPSDTAVANGAAIDVAVVAGLDAGAKVSVDDGRFVVSTGSQTSYLQVDGIGQAAAKAEAWHDQASSVEAIQVGDTMLGLSRPVNPEPGTSATVHRPPRSVLPPAVTPIVIADPPPPVPEPQPLSWATLLTPIPIALAMAFFFRPIFALFAAMGPVMALGRWFESRRRHRKHTRHRLGELARRQVELETAMARQAEQLALRRWILHPHVAELFNRAKVGSVRLWERRPETEGYLTFTAGVGEDHVSAVVAGSKPHREFQEPLVDPLVLRPVPHPFDLSEENGLGICGPRQHALAVARSAILQLATLHGPADLRVVVISDREHASVWDWLKWLPHTDHELVHHTVRPVVRSLDNITTSDDRTLASFAKDTGRTSPVTVLIVDSTSADVAAVERAALHAGRSFRVIAVAERPTSLPAVCSGLFDVADLSRSRLTTPTQGVDRPTMTATGISETTAVQWARALAGRRDPELLDQVSGQSTVVSLSQLTGSLSVERIQDRWASSVPGSPPQAVLGQNSQGAFSIDLTQDGPHALVAGTTGSGKSELLRSLILSLAASVPPDQLQFALLDFKGGGAFDRVTELPHVGGVVTDLDETLVGRVVASLRAELERREHVYRQLAVSEFEQAAAASPTGLPRLVLVIDEFAVLAADYPHLLDGIVDLAARGRSLGMHVVLATQRPSGVVDQKIRANTNLRIALRVQDAFDSQDVVGTAEAAQIDRRTPGSAIVVVGGDTPVRIQTAYTGHADRRSQRCIVRPHQLFASADGGEQPDHHQMSAHDRAPRSELDVVVEAIVHAWSDRSPIRALWADPLPEVLPWVDLPARLASSQSREIDGADLAIGLCDLPERQTQRPWCWHPDSGPLIVYGGSADCTAQTLNAIGAAIAVANRPDSAHVYVVDGGTGAVAALEELRHTGAYVRLTEIDRIERTIRHCEQVLLDRRSSGPDGDEARVVLMIENLGAVLSGFDELQAMALIDRLAVLARDGAPHRVHLVATARTVRDVSHRLGQHMPNRLAFALADPNAYLALGLRARDVPPLPGMRAIDLVTKRSVQMAMPPDLTELGDSYPVDSARLAVPIRSFPDRFPVGELGPPWIDETGTIHIPIGMGAASLEDAALSLRPGGGALIVGAAGMGRTTALSVIAAQLANLEPGPVVVVEATGMTAEELTAAAPTGDCGPIGVLLIDDAEAVGPEEAAVLTALLEGDHGDVRIVASSSLPFGRSMRSWVYPLRTISTGIVLGGQPADGELFQVRFDRLAGLGRLPGRGHIINRGRVVAAQIADATAGR